MVSLVEPLEENLSVSDALVRRSPSRTLWHRTFPELDQEVGALIDALKGGLPASRVDALTDTLGLPASRVADVLSIPTSTLNRRRKAGRLDRDESERAYRLARLVDRAADVFGSVENGVEWLKRPQFVLGGATPLLFADTEPGAREVEHVLGRIEHGVVA